MKSLIKLLLVVVSFTLIFSCKKDIENTKPDFNSPDTLTRVKLYIYNVPFSRDTLLLDKNYGVDFRMDLIGYKIDSIQVKLDESFVFFNSDIINTDCFLGWDGTHKILFVIKAIDQTSGKIVFLKTRDILVKFVTNLSQRFVKKSIDDGRLKIVWLPLDKGNTQYYRIKRSVGDKKQFVQEFQASDSVFIDNYYVGEEVNYSISVINKQGKQERTWNYIKEKEDPFVIVSQHAGNGYNINFSSCKYYNNLGQYKLTTGLNANPVTLYTASAIKDTSYNDPNALFGDEGRYWLRVLPKAYPTGVSEQNWDIYGHSLYMLYGKKSFQFDCISRIDENNIVYTQQGNIYKYDVKQGKIIDSINNTANYGFLRTTPSGNYIYATDQNLYNSPVYIWPSNKLSSTPQYTFQTDYFVPPMSDNLVALMPGKNSTAMALFDATNGSNIFTTPYQGTSRSNYISPNGNYIFIYDSNLKLCNYSNGTFTFIWSETQFSKSYSFYQFDAANTDLCYLFDDAKNFIIKKVADFSNVNSFTLNIESIFNIDYYSRRILGYVNGKLLVYDLDTGTLKNEIPADIGQLIFWGYKTALIGNKIYSCHGAVYELN